MMHHGNNMIDTDEATDEELIKMYSEGGKEAFRLIHQRYCERIKATVLRRLVACKIRVQDIDDIVQDVFLDLHSARHQFNPDLSNSTVRAFLFKSAERHTGMYLRHCHYKKRDERLVQHTVEMVGILDADDPKRKTASLVRDMLDALPEREADLLRLTWLEGHTYLSAAKLLRLPLTTVQYEVRSALQHLRERFAA